MIAKDSNVVVVTLAIKCLTSIANGLKKRFQPYATACIAGLLEKFREKKPSVVAVLREAVDAIFVSVSTKIVAFKTSSILIKFQFCNLTICNVNKQ